MTVHYSPSEIRRLLRAKALELAEAVADQRPDDELKGLATSISCLVASLPKPSQPLLSQAERALPEHRG